MTSWQKSGFAGIEATLTDPVTVLEEIAFVRTWECFNWQMGRKFKLVLNHANGALKVADPYLL
jgi:hypothetical protein